MCRHGSLYPSRRVLSSTDPYPCLMDRPKSKTHPPRHAIPNRNGEACEPSGEGTAPLLIGTTKLRLTPERALWLSANCQVPIADSPEAHSQAKAANPLDLPARQIVLASRPAEPIPRASQTLCRGFKQASMFGSRNSRSLGERCVRPGQFVSARRFGDPDYFSCGVP